MTVLASTETFGEDQYLTYVEPSTYIGRDGAVVIRLPYRRFLPHRLARKLRIHPGVYEQLRLLQPEVILFHGLCGWELQAMARYKRDYMQVRLFADSHEDLHNSARNFLSRHVLHRLYYAWIIRRCLSSIEKILCVSLETMDFVHTAYGVARDRLEFFPLGGRVYDDLEYQNRRVRGRSAAGVSEGQVMLLQTGKMGNRKKILQSIRAFIATPGAHMRLIVAGSFDEAVREEALSLIETDARIKFVGWQSTNALDDMLCGADVYLQPGTQSATMQMSLCARCPVILAEFSSHQPFVDGNGWIIRDEVELISVLSEISKCSQKLNEMSVRSLEIARRYLDYRILAKRILS